MKLLQFRIRSHPLVPDSNWCEVRRGINLLALDKKQEARAILQYLATINPSEEETLSCLKNGENSYHQRGSINKKIIPHKKTAALAVFSVSRLLINNIVRFDKNFYELNRIEVGRRFDQSRWMNFVEVSSSTRWSDLKPLVNNLLEQQEKLLPSHEITFLKKFISTLQDTDRIRRGLDEQILQVLHQTRTIADGKLNETYKAAMHLTKKNKRFLKAKEKAFAMLPNWPLYTFSKRGENRECFTSLQIQPDGKIKDPVIPLDKNSILLLDLTEAGREDILFFCSFLDTVPSKQSIVAVARCHLDLFTGRHHVIIPKK